MINNVLDRISPLLTQSGITLSDIVMAIALFLLVMGLRNIYLYATSGRIRRPSKIKNKRLREILEGFQSTTADSELFLSFGIRMNIDRYKSIRISVLIVMALMGCLSFLQGGSLTFWAIIVGLVMYVTYPKDELFHKKTPFRWFIEKMKSSYLQKRDDEIARIITQLKNLIVAQQDNPWSADYTIETLMRFSEMTKPIFLQTLRIHREGRIREACNYFAHASGTRLGRDFAGILAKLDELNPSEFMNQLTMFQSDIQAKKQTERLQKQKALGSLLFITTMIVCGFIIMDGMYIIMLQDALDRLQMMQ